MTENGKIPATRKANTVTVPKDLVEQTLTILLQHPASQVYALIQRWEKAVPGLIQYNEIPS